MAAGRLTASLRLRSSSSLLAGLLAALWAASLIPLVSVGTSNARLVEVFATDEAMQLNLLRGAAASHTFAITFGPYGHFVFNLILLALRVIPGALGDARIVQTGRSISVLFAAATLCLTFVWTKRVYGVAAAWIAFAVLLVNATLYVWAVALKPDMAQMFFLMLALALTCRLAEQPRARWLVLAGAASGLAFACKYSGLFVLPIVGAVAIWRPIEGGSPSARARVLRMLAAVTAIALLVVSTFLNVEWIASHLTEDGRIDASVSVHLLAVLTMAARGCAVALGALAAAPWLWSAFRRRAQVVTVLWSWLIASVAFAASFVVVSPYSLRKAAFIKGLFVEASDAAAPLSTQWLSLWLDGVATAVGWPVVVAALATMAGLLWMAGRRRAPLNPADPILIGWIVLYSLVLLSPVHEFYVQYALPLAPPAAMLAGLGAVAVAEWLAGVLGWPGKRAFATALLCVAILAIGMSPAGRLLAARTKLQNRESTNDAVLLGKWLECRVPSSARIAYDYFSYVPPGFHDVSPTWGGSRAWLAALNPDIVIVNNVTAGAVMRDTDHAEYYRCLAAGSCGYERVRSRGEISVYARSGQAGALLAPGSPGLIPGCERAPEIAGSASATKTPAHASVERQVAGG